MFQIFIRVVRLLEINYHNATTNGLLIKVKSRYRDNCNDFENGL